MSEPAGRTIEIHPAGPEHLADIAALADVVWRAHYPDIISHAQIDYMLERMYDLEVMRRELEDGVLYSRLLVDSVLRGFAAHGPANPAREWKLHKLYLHPQFQRRGLGTRLLQHVEHCARGQGCQCIVLAVNKRNAAAITAYLRHGFRIRESVVNDIGGGFVMDDYIMARPLA